ncbi:MAG: Cna B-type domain-containing protein, partial [Clostridia bacterium]|nr:Cna B-type domain-containing protein [Clostridia bacterium]
KNGDQWTTSITVPKFDATGNEITYTVTEDAVEKYTMTSNTGDAANGFVITNAINVGDLSISKTVVDEKTNDGVAPNPDQTFIFTVTLPDGEFDYTIKQGKKVVSTGTISNNGTIMLKDGQTATIENLPENTPYSVTETVPTGYVSETTIEDNGTVGAIDAGKTDAVTVENTFKVAELKITKTGLDIYAYGGDIDRESAIFTVTVTKDDLNFNKTYTIALANDGTATITGLPVGASYTITEQNDWTWRYNDVDPVEDEIENGTNSVTISNTGKYPYWLGGDNYKTNTFGN